MSAISTPRGEEETETFSDLEKKGDDRDLEIFKNHEIRDKKRHRVCFVVSQLDKNMT